MACSIDVVSEHPPEQGRLQYFRKKRRGVLGLRREIELHGGREDPCSMGQWDLSIDTCGDVDVCRTSTMAGSRRCEQNSMEQLILEA